VIKRQKIREKTKFRFFFGNEGKIKGIRSQKKRGFDIADYRKPFLIFKDDSLFLIQVFVACKLILGYRHTHAKWPPHACKEAYFTYFLNLL